MPRGKFQIDSTILVNILFNVEYNNAGEKVTFTPFVEIVDILISFFYYSSSFSHKTFLKTEIKQLVLSGIIKMQKRRKC